MYMYIYIYIYTHIFYIIIWLVYIPHQPCLMGVEALVLLGEESMALHSESPCCYGRMVMEQTILLSGDHNKRRVTLKPHSLRLSPPTGLSTIEVKCIVRSL